MAKAKSASSTQQGCTFTFSDATPVVFSADYGDTSPMEANVKGNVGLQGWTYFNESYIDLSGVTTTQEETAFIASADVQVPFTMQAYSVGPPVGPYTENIYEYFYILDRKMSKDDWYSSVTRSSGVGFTLSPVDQQSVIMAFQRTWSPRITTYQGSTSQVLMETAANNSGYATSTAAARLYCYHIIWSYTPNLVGNVTVPDCRFVVNYIADKEKDLAYLERLRRSYVQQSG